jgi:Domain of unknown function (DUF4398)
MRRTVAPILCRWRSSFLLRKGVAALCCSGALMGCVLTPPPPYEEFAIAQAAIRAAQDVDSARFATSTWHRADEQFRNGQKAFRDNDFAEARRFFLRATQLAESAENATRLKKFKSGEGFP